MSNSPRSGAKSQLITNRGILSQINPVVRKKSKARNILVPPEWDAMTSKAYRLLVGPKISDYVEIPKEEESNEPKPDRNTPKNVNDPEKLLANLYPSRLGEEFKPSEVTIEQLDALTLPNDLLVQVLPPGVPPKYDLLLLSQKKKSMKKPTIKKKPLPDLPVSLYTDDTLDQVPTTKSSFGLKSSMKLPMFQEEEEEEAPPTPPQPVEQKDDHIKKQRTIEEIEAKLQQKKLIRLRMYFYVLRCWACYNINARAKSVFITDVDNSRLLLHYIRHWNDYVQKQLVLRRCRAKLEEYIHNQMTTKSWQIWKTKGKKAIKHAHIAAQYLEIRNQNLQKTFFRLFKEVTYSKRIVQREIKKFYRFKPDGPFTEVNPYYTQKRALNVKALHHNFIKRSPPIIKAWKAQVEQHKKDKQQSGMVHDIIRRVTFHQWFELYKDHFHHRVLSEVRRVSKISLQKNTQKERDTSERVEKTVMIQLVHDRNILNAKLSQFDRLSQNHKEAVIRRTQLRGEIASTTNKYFVRQEELSLVDSFKQADEVEKKTREIRMQLAEGFLFHLGRAVRSYDNQVVAHEFCLAFRVLSNPIVEKAVGYFYEKKHIKNLLASTVRARKSLKQATTCVKIYHQMFGWNLWRSFIEKVNANRSNGIMSSIRRRTQIMQLYPYFNWVEVLPVRPPRPLKEVEQMFKDLPLVSIQRKVARERVHHVNVRMMLMQRRMLRDFIRAYASYVQEQIATRTVIMLLKKKQQLTLTRKAFAAFKATGDKVAEDIPNAEEQEISANITAWFRHFFRERARQKVVVKNMPLS
ncbi:hypothetical protein TVAG_263200 [Trichomonas vaginalis G3]|uniref:Uncharacterized protein n=1 Tax=Trichomonas vaginalis (strain ATCC PRA-98 / G3) TaxID=412133 RepID=A2FA67_TRIV3|nr:hypothetical protein TVAGG3_0390950 [Trichomonas vaginalis G3]EAX98203.1 hypothetical protein TVAG_263200 [Trichomonas vaginalis G3]KAI5533991.1 hypothetical protein TVAGG3_0390950 [Trichomonas vaginalis G3]|eukprot:XP_001311133.1 hypothetical protein [Trichomonas vaginalis G3]